MKTNLVITVMADDKPGLVESLSQTISSNSGNWLESSMSQLAGKFAGILRVSVENDKADKLVEDLKGLSSKLKLVIEKASDQDSKEPFQLVELNLVGNDRPGIIKEVSAALSAMGINVEHLNTECTPAPMSAASLFRARATLEIPTGLQLEKLQEELERLADDLIVEIELQ
jgi:glycine cleavage system regulatory protein